MKKFVFLMLAVFMIGGSLESCAQKVSKNDKKEYGESFKTKDVMKYDDLLSKLDTKKEMEVQVEGKVEGVCQAKGCWMNIVSDKDPMSEKMFVKFHDYGFFMPLDLAGSNVIMKGKAYVEETSVDELKHYAEDAGKSKEDIAKITQPKRELKFMATGVKIKG